MADCVIRNAQVVTPGGIVSGGVAVAGGRIAAVGGDTSLPRAHRTIDANRQWLLPGVIDPHVHLGLVLPFERDCETETRAAAAGGVTTLFSFVIEAGAAMPVLKRCAAEVEASALVNVGFHVAVMNRDHVLELPALVAAGVRTFKVFMAYRGEDGKRLGITSANDAVLFETLEAARALDGLVLVHAENGDLAELLLHRARGRRDLQGWADARPDFIEAESIQRVAFLAGVVGASVHVLHISSALGIRTLAAARARGVRISGETCPHYLLLSSDGASQPHPLLAKITPAIKGVHDQAALWAALGDGTIESLGSDHCSNHLSGKLGDDIWSTRPGFPGLETMLPLLITEGVLAGRLRLEQLVALLSTNTARLYGLYPRKGTIAVGADADLVLVDPEEEREIDPRTFVGTSDFTPFAGRRVRGWPRLTMVRGELVMEGGQVVGTGGSGTFVRMDRHGW